MNEWASRLAARGLDLVLPFDVAAWNETAVEEERLPTLGRGQALGAVIGNTRAVWEPFVAALRREPARIDGRAPFDSYVEDVIDGVLRGRARHIGHAARRPYPPLQRMAAASGLVHIGSSQLCIHPIYGPWIALRAVVVIDADPPPTRPSRAACCDCRRNCSEAMEWANHLGFDPADEVKWRAWLAVRDACPVGRAHRYSEAQIRYHYSRDRAILRAEVGEAAR